MDNELKNGILEAYEKIVTGMKRCDLEFGDGSTIKAYSMGNDVIRIDVKVEEALPF